MIHMISLILSLPLWAQSILFPVADRIRFVDLSPGGGYGYTDLEGRIYLGPECAKDGERERQCAIHEAMHVYGYGECMAYLIQLVLAVELKQRDESVSWARSLYDRYGVPACEPESLEGIATRWVYPLEWMNPAWQARR